MTTERIAVLGCGQVGAVTAAGLAELGHMVCGIDSDGHRVERLREALVPFYEPGLDQLIERNLSAGRLRFASTHRDGLEEAAFVFLCVDTPSTSNGAADLSALRGAVRQVAGILHQSGGRPVVVCKSTAPIGIETTIEAVMDSVFGGHSGIDVAANPEFLREGTAVFDFFHPHRLVIGADTERVARRVAGLYAGLNAPVILTDRRTAGLTKYVSNAFLATRISFVNEIARLCDALECDVQGVMEGVAMDPRIGGEFLTPGIGYGGNCLPKDLAALVHTAECTGLGMRLLSAVRETNASQPSHAVNRIRQALGSLEGATVAVWGLTFKAGTNDRRNSPALDVVNLLRNEGASVTAYDPTLDETGDISIERVARDPLSAVRSADGLAVLTDWPEFRQVSWPEVRRRMSGCVVFDGRNALSRQEIEAAGLAYVGVGRPPQHPVATDARQLLAAGGS
jgi:UDPglucose 6-dehydrogenase